ncbi:hypothetical protein DRW03_26475 [Corallococcus sp. H22C18031201]|uniref:hypothetical protein n=1 Tax=Citreicoccus inhibens TaxID=2849499 RepID=UPI000E756B80|nr:hypothetical protein [Citreicoccus inhibens]MBU8899517.1 hypothetical protein [Citreicoccus inhibens]RJS18087.1 hypothetical protein DRW03_26475 [Corallococcus sp. H22C18031201]
MLRSMSFGLAWLAAAVVLGSVACGETDAADATAEGERKRCADRTPELRYVSRAQQDCHDLYFVCRPGETAFLTACGCGCALPAL